MQLDFQIAEGDDKAVNTVFNDKINDAYELVYALANFLSPIIRAACEKKFDQ